MTVVRVRAMMAPTQGLIFLPFRGPETVPSHFIRRQQRQGDMIPMSYLTTRPGAAMGLGVHMSRLHKPSPKRASLRGLLPGAARPALCVAGQGCGLLRV